jgi:hypothetical protein
MASHGPYDSVYMPQENVRGGGPGTSAEMSEYLRRAGMAMRDDDFLMEEIRRRFPHERILVVRYGDHQPSATREYLDRLTGRRCLRSPRSMFTTATLREVVT